MENEKYQDAREQGKLSGQMEILIDKVKEIDDVLHKRIDSAKDDVESLQRDMNQIKGGIKVTWAIILVLITICSGIAIKVFSG